jgi:Uma2 family endonuclease
MATVPAPLMVFNDYPYSDGKPMAETDLHRDLMNMQIEVLKQYYEGQDDVYVSGNLLMFYEKGNKRRHVSPDVFVVKGVPNHMRPNYLVWEEGRAPNLVIEMTSSSTRREDVGKKFKLYQDVLKVREYFLFDPYGDYLKPPMQGYRLVKGEYREIGQQAGRLPSLVLGLHLERDEKILRLWNPATSGWLPTRAEQNAILADENETLRQRIAELEARKNGAK